MVKLSQWPMVNFIVFLFLDHCCYIFVSRIIFSSFLQHIQQVQFIFYSDQLAVFIRDSFARDSFIL